MKYLIYDTGTGRILRMPECPEGHIEAQLKTGESYVESGTGVSDKTHYLDASLAPQLLPATPCTLSAKTVPADGQSVVTLSGLSADTAITIRGPVSDEFTATGSVDLTFTLPGTYTITATAPFPATSEEHTINAT